MFNFTMNSFLEAILEATSSASVSMMDVITRFDAEVRAATYEFAAKFASTSTEFRERFGPGTVPGDSLTIAGQRATAIEREDACRRLASALGLGVRQRLRPRAVQALRSIAQYEGLAESEILGREIPIALTGALIAFDEADQTHRDGRVWRKDAQGKIQRFMPADEYTLPDLLGGRGQAHLRDLARRYLESALIERSGLLIDDDSHIEWTEIHAPSPPIEEEILNLAGRKQAALVLETVIPQLSRREREVLELVEEKTHEIARKLGLKEPTVRRVKADIRKKVTKVLKKNMIGLAKSSPLIDRRPTDGKIPGYPRRSHRQQI
jgi:DNA-binding CsgD family transcriptional regulator